MFEVNWFVAIVMAFVPVVFAIFWYSRAMFGHALIRLTNITPEQLEFRKRRSATITIASFVFHIFTAVFLQNLVRVSHAYSLSALLILAFALLFGVVVPVLFWQVAWEGKSPKLFVINGGYWFIVLFVMLSIASYF